MAPTLNCREVELLEHTTQVVRSYDFGRVVGREKILWASLGKTRERVRARQAIQCAAALGPPTAQLPMQCPHWHLAGATNLKMLLGQIVIETPKSFAQLFRRCAHIECRYNSHHC
jgi:hypothetical protein